jgi:hypothetical protein
MVLEKTYGLLTHMFNQVKPPFIFLITEKTSPKGEGHINFFIKQRING